MIDDSVFNLTDMRFAAGGARCIRTAGTKGSTRFDVMGNLR